jgi:hypothetical protein
MYMGEKLIQNSVILLHDIRKIAKIGKKLDSFRCSSPLVYKVNWNLVTKATCTSICEMISIHDLSVTTDQKFTCSPCNQPTAGSEFAIDYWNFSRPVQYILDLGTGYVQSLAQNMEYIFFPPEIICLLVQYLRLLSIFFIIHILSWRQFGNITGRHSRPQFHFSLRGALAVGDVETFDGESGNV